MTGFYFKVDRVFFLALFLIARASANNFLLPVSGNWTDAALWDGGLVPTSDATITAAGTFTVYVGEDVSLNGTLTFGGGLSKPTLQLGPNVTFSVRSIVGFGNSFFTLDTGAKLIVEEDWTINPVSYFLITTSDDAIFVAGKTLVLNADLFVYGTGYFDIQRTTISGNMGASINAQTLVGNGTSTAGVTGAITFVNHVTAITPANLYYVRAQGVLGFLTFTGDITFNFITVFTGNIKLARGPMRADSFTSYNLVLELAAELTIRSSWSFTAGDHVTRGDNGTLIYNSIQYLGGSGGVTIDAAVILAGNADIAGPTLNGPNPSERFIFNGPVRLINSARPTWAGQFVFNGELDLQDQSYFDFDSADTAEFGANATLRISSPLTTFFSANTVIFAGIVAEAAATITAPIRLAGTVDAQAALTFNGGVEIQNSITIEGTGNVTFVSPVKVANHVTISTGVIMPETLTFSSGVISIESPGHLYLSGNLDSDTTLQATFEGDGAFSFDGNSNMTNLIVINTRTFFFGGATSITGHLSIGSANGSCDGTISLGINAVLEITKTWDLSCAPSGNGLVIFNAPTSTIQNLRNFAYNFGSMLVTGWSHLQTDAASALSFTGDINVQGHADITFSKSATISGQISVTDNAAIYVKNVTSVVQAATFELLP
eukprot:TRINITY_DN2929_c0_g2_i3.p1 TRINITY_DN2929_c0_g2~~TRINITY_DN2929_c0_g2_i3.p1  ORF type:complete len:660 (-),score=108.19 TRINITY_DN2929_c0_g2_i3:91-2070(-)